MAISRSAQHTVTAGRLAGEPPPERRAPHAQPTSSCVADAVASGPGISPEATIVPKSSRSTARRPLWILRHYPEGLGHSVTCPALFRAVSRRRPRRQTTVHRHEPRRWLKSVLTRLSTAFNQSSYIEPSIIKAPLAACSAPHGDQSSSSRSTSKAATAGVATLCVLEEDQPYAACVNTRRDSRALLPPASA